MNHELKKKISTSLAIAILSLGSISAAEAAEAVEMPAGISVENPDIKDEHVTEFLARVQKILDEAADKNLVRSEQENTAEAMPGEKKPVPEVVRSEQEKKPGTQVIQAPVVLPEADYEQRFDFDWQGTPLNTSLYAISKVSGKKVVINGSLSGTVYTSLHRVTYNEALSYLAKAFNFNYMIDGSAILISTDKVMMQSETFNVRYVYNLQNLKEEIKSMGIDEGSIFVNQNQGTVSVTGTPYQLSQVSKRLNSIDRPVQQCLLIAQLIEVDHGDSLDLGMSYSLPTYSHTSGDTFNGKFAEKLTFSASMDAAKAMNKGHVIARPMIITHNGEEAQFNMSSSVPVMTSTATTASTSVTVEYKDVGTIMKVKPLINTRDNQISLSINTEVSNIVGWVNQGQSTAPQINKRVADTSVTVKAGQSFVIGGLMNVEELDNLSGIPGLMDIPILGKLFSYHKKSKSYSEIFIMVTPYIVSDDIDPQALLKGVQ